MVFARLQALALVDALMNAVALIILRWSGGT
jgi:hypothetical protein